MVDKAIVRAVVVEHIQAHGYDGTLTARVVREDDARAVVDDLGHGNVGFHRAQIHHPESGSRISQSACCHAKNTGTRVAL